MPLTQQTDADAQPGGSSHDFAWYPRQFPSYAWYKPILVGLLTFAFAFAFQSAVIAFASLFALDGSHQLNGPGSGYDAMNPFTVEGALVNYGSVAVLLPALAFAALVVRDRPFSSYATSRDRWNWNALLACTLVALGICVVGAVAQSTLFPNAHADGVVKFSTASFVLCIVLVPVQCVAEEFLFRGYFLQTIGAWTKSPAIGIVASALIAAGMHSYNVVGVVGIFLSGLLLAFATWKCGGLEAACAFHIVNNLIGFVTVGLGMDVITSEATIPSAALTVAMSAVYVIAVLQLSRKCNWFAPRSPLTATKA